MEETVADRLAVVVADHIVSPLGFSTSDNYAAVKAGQTGLQRYSGKWGLPEPFMAALIDRDEALAVCERAGIHGHYTFFERLAILSVQQALQQCEVDVTSSRTLLILSTTKGNVDLLRESQEGIAEERVLLGEAAKTIAAYFGNPNQPMVVSNACISGVCAQIEAERLLKAGVYDAVIVCGGDILSPFIVSGFQSLMALTDTPCRPFDEDRTGINLGDAVATIIYKGVTERREGVWTVAKGAIRNDGYHISSPSKVGEGSFRALRHILEGVDPEEIAVVNAHGTATLFNDEMESVAIDRAGLGGVPVNSLKGYYGHTMGAAGILETIITMRALD
jgi:3-oxoacyl-[acyl-carrier-protein] synthase-1